MFRKSRSNNKILILGYSLVLSEIGVISIEKAIRTESKVWDGKEFHSLKKVKKESPEFSSKYKQSLIYFKDGFSMPVLNHDYLKRSDGYFVNVNQLTKGTKLAIVDISSFTEEPQIEVTEGIFERLISDIEITSKLYSYRCDTSYLIMGNGVFKYKNTEY